MAIEWREYTIGEIADIIGGSTPSTSDPDNFNGDIPWLTPKDLSGPHDRYISRGERNLSRKGLASCSAQLLPSGAVLLSSRAPVGYVAIAKNPVATNQGFRSLVLKPGFEPEFVYYWLKANVDELERHASGSTFKELSGLALAQITIRLPDHRTQRAIAHILGTLDDKIELNRRMNATLEAIARAIFKSWFVDFDPVHAKARGEQPYGMDADTAALFPDAFEDSELGPIPAGWRVKPIGDTVTVVGGSTPRTKVAEYWEGGTISWATPKDLASLSSPVLLETSRQITEKGLAKISSGLLPKGTVLLSSRAPVGYLAIAEIPVAVNQGFIAMVCDQEMPSQYVYNWAKANMDLIESQANGTTFLEISKRNFRPIQLLIPPKDILCKFSRLTEPIYRRIVCNEKEIRTLAALRDALLPKLISGEICVNALEEISGG